MRKADFRNEGTLNEKNIQLVFENKSKVIEELLKITTVEEFIDVFDNDMVRLFFIKRMDYLMKMSKF